MSFYIDCILHTWSVPGSKDSIREEPAEICKKIIMNMQMHHLITDWMVHFKRIYTSLMEVGN